MVRNRKTQGANNNKEDPPNKTQKTEAKTSDPVEVDDPDVTILEANRTRDSSDMDATSGTGDVFTTPDKNRQATPDLEQIVIHL